MSSAEEQALPTYEDVVSAYELIKGTVKRTPVHTSETFDALSGRQLFFKCELFQKGGAFKYRGATNACMRLPEGITSVVTHSSGNHAQALSLAARAKGIDAHIIMPSTSPAVKKVLFLFVRPELYTVQLTAKKAAVLNSVCP
jgi:threonine dehydratase